MALTAESAARKDARNAGAATFEHRHFATIASIINGTRGHTFDQGEMAELFADALRATNPRFDRARFLKACGVA